MISVSSVKLEPPELPELQVLEALSISIITNKKSN